MGGLNPYVASPKLYRGCHGALGPGNTLGRGSYRLEWERTVRFHHLGSLGMFLDLLGFTGVSPILLPIFRTFLGGYSHTTISHGVITTCTCFFFEVPSFEEVQDPSSSPRREEVGRRTLGDYGGFLLPFFYRDRFQ